jgi:Domain of unknown function (DUF5680)
MSRNMNLETFIITAKAACYVGSGASAEPSRRGAHDLAYADGPWTYRDSYFGGTDFIGQEVVWHDSTPHWGMNYYGRVLRPDLIDGERAGRVIKTALSALYRQGRFLGGFELDVSTYRYTDSNSGTFNSFTGVEYITRDGRQCYRLEYAGGLVRD